MTENEKNVLALHAQLTDIDTEYLEQLAQGMYWHDWDCNCDYSDTIRIGQAVGKYQVIRHFDVECCNRWEAINLSRPKDWPEWISKVDIDDYEEYDYEDEDEDGNKVTYRDIMLYDYAMIGEYMQEWIDCETGEIIILGKPYAKDRFYLDTEADWELITEDDKFARLRGYSGVKTHHIDLSVNDLLLSYGYKPFNICPCDDLNYSEDADEQAYYDMKVCVSEYICDIIKDIRVRKANQLLGTNLYALVGSYDTALKILCRNNYQPTDFRQYLRYLGELNYLGKDMHNPHFVCPSEDTTKKVFTLARNRRAKERRRLAEERERQRIYEEEHADEMFDELRAPYLGIAFNDGEFFVHVLQSKDEYVEEGEVMHHCVGRLGFWKKKNSICVSIRDAKGHREATAEISLDKFCIIQCFTYCNQFHKRHEQIVGLLESNMWQFKIARGSALLAEPQLRLVI